LTIKSTSNTKRQNVFSLALCFQTIQRPLLTRAIVWRKLHYL
jgi:hypothetical protein